MLIRLEMDPYNSNAMDRCVRDLGLGHWRINASWKKRYMWPYRESRYLSEPAARSRFARIKLDAKQYFDDLTETERRCHFGDFTLTLVPNPNPLP